MFYRPTALHRKRVLTILLALYSTALLMSMAGMEIVSWTLVAASLVFFCFSAESIKDLRLGLEMPLLGLVLAVIASECVNGHGLRQTLATIGHFRWIVLLYVLVWAVRSSGYLPEPAKVLGWLTIVFLVIAAVSLQQALTGVDLWRPKVPLRPFGELHRAEGFFNMCITFANAIGIQAVFFLGRLPQVWREKNRFRTLCFAAMFAWASLGVFLSFTRGAWIAWLIACVIFAIVAIPNRKLVAVAVATAVLAAIMTLMLRTESENRTAWFEASAKDQSFAQRLEIWEANWEIFRGHPVFGVGWNQGDKFLKEAYASTGHPGAELFSHSHNNVLQILAGLGILGFAFWAWICGAMIWRSACLLRSHSAMVRSIALGTLLGQIYFHVCGMTDCNFIDSEVTHNLVWMWVLTLAAGEKGMAYL